MRLQGGATRGALLVGVAAAVIALDQWSKSWAQRSLRAGVPRHVLGPLSLVLTYNKGAAFSLGQGSSPIIEALAVVLVVGLLWWSGRLAHGGASLAALVFLGLIGGGALSNLSDRFFRHHHGAVVDFVQAVGWWPVFNVADATITIGAVGVALSLVLSSFARPHRREADKPETAGPAEQGSHSL